MPRRAYKLHRDKVWVHQGQGVAGPLLLGLATEACTARCSIALTAGPWVTGEGAGVRTARQALATGHGAPLTRICRVACIHGTHASLAWQFPLRSDPTFVGGSRQYSHRLCTSPLMLLRRSSPVNFYLSEMSRQKPITNNLSDLTMRTLTSLTRIHQHFRTTNVKA